MKSTDFMQNALIGEVEPVAFMCQGNIYNMDDIDEHCTAVHKPLFTAEAIATAVANERERAAKLLDQTDLSKLPDEWKVFFAQLLNAYVKAIREGNK